MADLIRSDIEKIERALNICVDDVGFEVALNAAFPQTRSLLCGDEQLDENSIRLPDFYHLVEDFHEQTCADDYSSVLTFPTALNSCYQRNLLQLSRHYQSIENALKSSQVNSDILPMQTCELYTSQVSSDSTSTYQSIQTIRRMMQREEKARLTSTEIVGKLIETIAQTMREIKQQELTRRIERLEASPRHANDAKEELDLSRRAIENLGILSDHELIAQYDEQISIDWRRISEIFMNNQYTAKSCEHAWQELCLPSIRYNHPWSAEEDQLLDDLVHTHGSHADQWTSIASHFPQRSPYMCANRYMFRENRRQDKMKFSSERINELKRVIDECRHENYVPLNRIAHKLGSSLASVRREWRNTDPSVRRGQWQVDEDEALLRSVLKQSTRETINWHLVASEIPGRSQNKCYHRYIHLTRQQSKTMFTAEDDQLLIEQHHLKHARWSQIHPFFPGRSSYALQNRWRKLQQYRQMNELFRSLQSAVQSFILKFYPTKTIGPWSSTSTSSDLYHPPVFQLTPDQLQCLSGNHLFIQFCLETDLNDEMNSMGIRQFLKKLSTWTDVQQMRDELLLLKRTRRKPTK